MTDESGVPVAAATISIQNVETGQTRSLPTDRSGRYRAPGLSSGNYDVRAEREGLQAGARSGISLTVGREAVVDFTLGLTGVRESVVVKGEASPVDTTESTVGYLVDEKKIRDLPLNGRDFARLILLQPGITMSRASSDSSNVGRGTKISVAGSRPNQNLFTLDGTDYNDALNNTPGSAQGLMTGVETIKEFQVLTNTMSAEYGRASGGVFNVVTKSGTNLVHGSVFGFYRNDALDSKDFFDDEKPRLWRDQFGGSLGGPIAHDKTFFFTSYEGLRGFKGITTLSTVPDDDARRGVLPGKPPFTVSPNIQPYLALYPVANGPRILDANGNPTGVAEFRGVTPTDSSQDFALARVDHIFSETDSIFLRYLYDNSVNDEVTNFPAFPNIVRNRKRIATVEERHGFSPAVWNEFRFGFSRSQPSEDIDPVDPHTDIAFVGGKAFGEMNVTGLTDIGTDRNNPKSFFQDLYQLSDNLSLWTGPHAFRVGFNAERFEYEGDSESRTRGQLRFRTLEDFLRGRTRDFVLSRPGSDFGRNYRQDLFGIYIQDDFQAAPRLTFNVGLRWEFVTTPRERDGKVSNLRNIGDSTVTVGNDLFRNPTRKDLAPRVGVVWDATGDGKTAVRAGFGIFYDQPLFFHYRSPIFRSLPFVERVRISSPALPIHLDNLGSAGPPETESFQYDLEPSYVEQYNVNVERDLGFLDTVVSVGYFGSHGVHLFGQGDINTAVPQILADGTEFFPANSPRRNPNFGIVRSILQGFESHYNGLHVGLARRPIHGFQFQASYAYGKCIDNRSGAGGREEFSNGQARTFDPYDFNRDKGRCDYDVRHNAVFNTSYDLPLGKGKLLEGWQISAIVTYASGIPFTPIIAGDPDRDGSDDNAARPNRVPGCDPENVPGGRGPDRWFNTACFSFPALGTRGNAGRNSLNGPDFKDVDLSLVKTTSLSGGLQLQIRLEVFNLFNWSNFDIPANTQDGATLFDANGARLADAAKLFRTVSDPREVQLGIRLLF